LFTLQYPCESHRLHARKSRRHGVRLSSNYNFQHFILSGYSHFLKNSSANPGYRHTRYRCVLLSENIARTISFSVINQRFCVWGDNETDNRSDVEHFNRFSFRDKPRAHLPHSCDLLAEAAVNTDSPSWRPLRERRPHQYYSWFRHH
jgi:hypothetical protein